MEWRKLASLIQSNFLREDLIPDSVRSDLRKTLALLDEPEAAYGYFAGLVETLDGTFATDAERIRAIRQLSVCLWISPPGRANLAILNVLIERVN